MNHRFIFLLVFVLLLSCHEKKANYLVETATFLPSTSSPIKVIPILHASFILEAGTDVIYIDPTGGANAYIGQKRPTAIFITDIHGDHLNISTLEELKIEDITLVAPPAVLDKIPSNVASNTFEAINNVNYKLPSGLEFSTIPMYNLRNEALKFHPKGRGNGYILKLEGERIYISGDTEDIPEMRTLNAIDKAFICMNLPYTMTVESAADAVIEFGPKEVYPYHYRGPNGFSDVGKFEALVTKGNSDVSVIRLNWYK